MTFFDKKQDVLKIELTPYGRSLLSNGNLMPKFYAFFDDDIVYDIATLGATEEQNQIKTRILQETPRIKPQRDILSPEGAIFTFERDGASTRPHSKLSLNYLTEPIGTSDGTEENASSWHLTTIMGEIDSVEQTLSSNNSYLRQIPQVNMTIEYTMQIRNTRDDSPLQGQQSAPTLPVSKVFDDGTYLEILDEQVIARILEDNGFKFKEGLEVEAFLYSEDEAELHPLKMTPKTKSIIDGILVDPDESFVEIDKSYVEYYLSILFDEDIPDADLCKGISKLQKEDILLDIAVDCPDEQGVDFDIYRTRITDVERC